MPITSPRCHPCFGPVGYTWEIPKTPSLGWSDLLEWRSELRRTAFPLFGRSVRNGHDEGHRRVSRGNRKMRRTKCMAWGVERPRLLQGHLSPSTPVSNLQALWTPDRLTFLYRFITEAWSAGLLSPCLTSPFAGERVWGENSKLLIIAGCSWRPVPVQEPTQNHLIRAEDLQSPGEFQGI